ncbi:ATP-dependent helicase Lhr [Gluconacetobacter johannae DSM 13595]|uniref:ATP-dependent helicase n=1 Tax=Gluconacetobacter johannae TaxID=112140 RepID=A0A7W4P2C1_9PROT|nr:ATP-dependent helicase [Gluconacetobacter johannae]MBB2174867.1 ATP-dependent helicase [Gluconacetobacter johannae]GBQ87589.1 ATP-dependent helicase Lhr [Gluconacetobacter johannae DSM 13595]
MTLPTKTPAADPLARFAPATRAWFEAAFASPTAAQAAAWTVIGAGDSALVIAPTGSGKTLAAFLHAIDRLFREREAEAAAGTPPDSTKSPTKSGARAVTRVLYISPIKALGADVQRNLRLPLHGVGVERKRRGDAPVEITVGMRTGDTPSAERAGLLRRPPDILITTPESLYLMLTSRARETLRGVNAVIVDEVHAVAGTKRGAHLVLSLERLDALLATPAQRIGLSATVRPVDRVAQFLGGARPVTVVNPPSSRRLDLKIVVPVEDMSDLAATGGQPGDGERSARSGSIWPHVEASILDKILGRRATIVFANSRGLAEKLTARLNELYAERLAQDAPPAPDAGPPLHYASVSGGTEQRSMGAPPLLARSHHGSVSKEQRREIESALKAGALRCVVATSSLELGIDMGLVDLVIQVAAPPSVASGLQRVGRAGHQVGGASSGLVYPRTRRDLVDATVTVESMRAGRIEAIDPPRNPLDVLAQQTVAAVAVSPLAVEDWYAMVRRAAPFSTLPRGAFDATLDMLAGRYPSDDFAAFRPRLVWNREAGLLTPRPGALQLAVTSGGTIPDRGLFAVVLPEGEERAGSRRVGELDEEMVYESRVNDIITLGTTSWRIEQITNDQVIVTPAPGRSARLPFWHGDGVRRPAELGEAIGAFLAALDAGTREETPDGDTLPRPEARLRAAGLDTNAIANMRALIDEQRAATGVLPTDRTLVVERCRDEAGDWRVILHSPYGRRVHDPWALAIAARVRRRFGIDPSVVASDDGIVARLPDTAGRVPGADLFTFDPDKLRGIVTEAVGGSALFAARFRECAARALLLPRRAPGHRSPLWQQRLRAGQLLEIVRDHPDFPILVETARECLQDVYDLAALDSLARRLADGAIRIVEVTTEIPSPFAADLLFGYVAEFMYATDAPIAERRASVLSLDSGLLADLLGEADLGTLLDPVVIDQVESELQRLAPAYRAKGQEGVADLVRELGPLSAEEVARRLADGDAEAGLAALATARRVIRVTIAGRPCWAAVEDAARLRDALGITPPARLPDVFGQPVADPLRDLVARYARTHGPFTTNEVAVRFGLGVTVADAALERLRAQGKLLKGNFGAERRLEARDDATGPDSLTRNPLMRNPLARHEWVADDVFRRLRLRSLQAAREATRPARRDAYIRLLLERHGLTAGGALTGIDAVARVVEQLAGMPLPASVWENQILRARVHNYSPAMLDELIATGAVLWCGHGKLGGEDGLVSLHPREFAAETLPPLADAEDRAALSPLQRSLLDLLADGGAYFARQLATLAPARLAEGPAGAWDGGSLLPVSELDAALWGLAWAGYVTSDSWSPLRARSGAPQRPRPIHLSRRRRGLRGFSSFAQPRTTGASTSGARGDPTLAGRWSLLPREPASDTARALALVEGLLDRYGIVTRGAAVAEDVPGGFPALQPILRSMEDAGQILRGRFVEGLGASQFAERATVDRLRELADTRSADPVPAALSAGDPANPFGTILPWPPHPSTIRPTRRGGAFVVIAGERLMFYLTQGGRTLLTYVDADADMLRSGLDALAAALRREKHLIFTLEMVDDRPVRMTRLDAALRACGFSMVPKGLSWHQ